jgi:hypothetical protein
MADDEAAPTAVAPMGQQNEVEKLESEKKRLEEELRYVQLQMTDILNLNDGLLVELRQKDKSLVKREEYFAIISEKNATELAQLEIETECAEQMSVYDIEVLQGQVNRLQLQKERYNTLSQENKDLEEAFMSMQEEVSQTSMDHSLGIHEMNKDMLAVRENLEAKLRYELTAMDHRYQQRAFASLNEADKRDILDNAKLKDEVTLQSIGIANLTLRMEKQKHGTEVCNEEIHHLNKQTSHLRDQLSDLALSKIHRNKTISKLDEEIQTLQTKKSELGRLLQKDFGVSELTDVIEECKEKIKAERLSADLWQKRLEAIFRLQDEMIPTNSQELDGKFSSSTHKLFSTSASLAGEETTNWEDTGHGGGARLSDIDEAMARDPTLRQALKSFIGKESAVMGGKSEVEVQNMAAWVICQVIKAWMKSKADLLGEFERLEKKKERRLEAKRLLVGMEREDVPTEKVDEREERGPNQDEVDDMWDDVFMTDSHNMDSAASTWYGLRDNAKRIPSDIKVGTPSLSERFNFDSIRPANISYDLDPPVTKFSVSQSANNIPTMRRSQNKETAVRLDPTSTTSLLEVPGTSRGAIRKKDALKSAVHHSIKPASGILMMTKAHSVSNLHKPGQPSKRGLKGVASTNML